MKRLLSFFIPGGLLFLAALLMLHVPGLKPAVFSILPFAPYVVFLSAVLIGLRFNRSALVFSMVILAFAHMALSFRVDRLPVFDRNAWIVYHATAFLLPANLMILSLMRERGVFTYYGISRMAFVACQPLAVFIFARLNPEVLLGYLDAQLVNLPALGQLAVSQPALLSFSLALMVMLTKFALDGGAKESGFFWSLITVFSALASMYDSSGRLFLFTVAGLILLVSIIETSHAMAFRDELTGLPARRALKEDLLKLGSRYVLAMVDIDHFKKFNDTYGHDVGDQVLRMVAAKLGGISGGGRAFRYGGEEFTVIFAGKHAENARVHLEELRREVELSEFVIRRRFRPRNKPRKIKQRKAPQECVSVTISIGMAGSSEKHDSPQAVLKEADKALYRAKNQGRNRVCT